MNFSPYIRRTFFSFAFVLALAACAPCWAADEAEVPSDVLSEVLGAAMMPGMVHDHGSKHGGQVGMSGSRHLEALATPQGLVRVYLSNFARRAVSLDGVSGAVFLAGQDASVGDDEQRPVIEQRFELQRVPTPTGDALEAVLPAPTTDTVEVRFELVTPRDPIDMGFSLPVAEAWLGDTFLPVREPAAPDAPSELRYTLRFAAPVNAIAGDSASKFFVAAYNMTTTAWDAAEGRLLAKFDPPSPAEVLLRHDENGGDNHDHTAAMLMHAPGLLAVNPVNGQLASAHLGQVALHTFDDPRPQVVWPLPRGIPWAMEWLSDGKRLLVTHAYDRVAHVLDAGDGTPVSQLKTSGLITTAAAGGDAHLAVVASGRGEIQLFDIELEKWLLDRHTEGAAVRALAVDEKRVAAASEDGVLHVWDTCSRTSHVEQSGLGALNAVAFHARGRVLATAGFQGTVHLFSADGRESLGQLRLHRELVSGLAWVGDKLISADAAGLVAVWDLASVVAVPADSPKYGCGVQD
ncbi:MAG: hypothetical protein ACI8TX_001860 [Hyphomicrobiaceae bacterium]|jgi:hypothetical protein